jgi:hypothetical protein
VSSEIAVAEAAGPPPMMAMVLFVCGWLPFLFMVSLFSLYVATF